MAQYNERRTIVALLAIVIVCLLGALYIQCSGKLGDIEVTTSVIDRREAVESTTPEFEKPSDEITKRLVAAGYQPKFSVVTTTAEQPHKGD